MTITVGEEAGIVFRADGNNDLYYFYIDVYGNYGVYWNVSTKGVHAKELISRTGSTVIKRGRGQPNELAVIARGSNFTLYINSRRVNQFADMSYSTGEIGICVGDYNDFYPGPFNATYQDAKVWKLKP
jgi:hypothetical protein